MAIQRNMSRRFGTVAVAACVAALAGCGVAMAAPTDAHAATAKLTGVTATADGQAHTVNASVKGAYGNPEVYYATRQLTKQNYKNVGSTDPAAVARTKAGTTKVYVAYVYRNAKNSSKVFKAKSTTINIKPSVDTEGTVFKGGAEKAYKGTYDQVAHSVKVIPGKSAAADYEVYYSTKKTLSADNYAKYGSKTVPTRTKAGSTKVYWIAVPADGAANVKNVTRGYKTISIAKKTLASADVTASADLATAMAGYGFTGTAGTDDSTAENTKYYYNAKPFSDTASGANKLVLDVRDRGAAGQSALEKGKDYTVRYTNNSKMGTAAVTLTGTGNYAGKKTIKFSIVSKTISECYFKIGGVKVGTGASINASAAGYEYKYYSSSKLVKPSVEVYTDANYTNLVSTMNIKKAYDQGKNDKGDYPNEGTGRVIGQASVTVTGWHNFSGETTITFNVVAE